MLGGYAGKDDKERFDSMPTVAGRPAFVSSLTGEEQTSMNEALSFLEKVESSPDDYFSPMVDEIA